MKKIFSIFILFFMAMSFVCADEVITQDANRLPQAAQQFISTYFAKAGIAHIKIESEFLRGNKYEVLLTDRTEVDFDAKGNWQEIDCHKKAVPESLIPMAVKEYVKVNFPREIITKIDRRRNIEVELTNNYSLKFNKKGKFIEMDD